MTEAERLRRQAERALRLARGILDETANRALRDRAAELLAMAQELEQGAPAPPESNG
jgi:hypothetical protein